MIHRYIIEATDEVKGFEEAIERLDREWGIEELEPCEDTISRQALQEWIKDKTFGDIVVASEHNFDCLPSVTPHSKTGHWITWEEAGNDIPSETRFECSVCHDAAQTLCNGLDLLSPYCPNCGAKMQEMEEE